jgi:mycothiol maleylpyruvate isomerase-like protein
MIQMTEADLLKALADAQAPTATDDPGWTVAELAIHFHGVDNTGNRMKITKRLQVLKAEGRLKIGKRKTERLNGSIYPVPVFSVVKKAKR